MKKLCLIFLCSITLFTLCGCGKNSITGKYKQTNYNDGYLTLYKNGSCYWKQIIKGYSETVTFEYDSDNCTYDYIDDEITINTKFESEIFGTKKESHNCKFTNGTIDCNDYGTYSK